MAVDWENRINCHNRLYCMRLQMYIHAFNFKFMGPCIVSIFQYISNKMQRYTVYFIWKLLYLFRVVLSPIIRSAYNFIYSIWYLSHRYCYLPLSWTSWNRFECVLGGGRHPQPTETGST
jgi:hypothetical protein